MLQANYLMGRATFALVAGKIVQYGATFLAIYFLRDSGSSANLGLVFAATLAGSIVTTGLSLWFVRQHIQWQWHIDRTFMFHLLRISLPFGVINIVNNLYFRFLPDYFAQSSLTGSQFATFNISFRLAQVVSLVSTFLMFSVLPGFKEYIDAKHWHKAKSLYEKVWKILALAGVVLFVTGSLFGNFAIEILTHQKYVIPEFWFLLPLMLLLAAVSYGYDLVLITLFAMEDDLWFLKREFVALAITLGFSGFIVLSGDAVTKLWFIIGAALASESFIVVVGIFRIHWRFQNLPALPAHEKTDLSTEKSSD
jgi:O-antigen/teichoic acid export membrane protein